MMRRFGGNRKAEDLLLPVVAAGIAAVLAGAGFVSRRAAAADPSVDRRPIQAEVAGFRSSDTCRACHPSQYASWHASYHRTMTQVATPETVATSFDGVTVETATGGAMRLEQRGRQLWAEFADPDAISPISDAHPTSTRPTPDGPPIVIRQSSRPAPDGPPIVTRQASRPAPDGRPIVIRRSSDAQPTASRRSADGRITRQVVMTTGSHNQQIFWYATGNSRVLGQLPAIWLTAEQTWIPRRAAIMAPPSAAHYSETGAWNGICVSCHTTVGQPRLDAPLGSRPIADQTADTRAAEFGIACEACHGPGDAHATANRSPLRRYTLHLTRAADPTIVQPARLDPRRGSQVCGQCHSFWEFADAHSEREANAHGLPYRPGDDLAATRFVVQPTKNLDSPAMQAFLAADAGFVRDIFWSDGMIRATGREYNGLIESPCYARATDPARTMTCFTCHTMHKAADDLRPLREWADDQLSSRALGDAACTQCHRMSSAHSHHRAGSSGSACDNCHMPHTTYGLLKTIRSHQISSPSVQATIDTGRPNACNLCHLDKTLGWTADRLAEWYGQSRPAVGEDEESVAASVLLLLEGDAGQRAIVAQAMGWRAAQEVSGTGWLAPYLALTQKDQYDAVRLIASRSSKTLPPFSRDQLPRGNAQLLIKADGTFDAARVNRLVRERNNRRLVYRE
jgi:Cytochrome c554 and c-prime